MKENKYTVTFYYHTSVPVDVTAEDRESAIAKAESEILKDEYRNYILQNLEEDGDTDVEMA